MREAYDYIIIGAGCAGLSLLMRLMDDDQFDRKRVLLIDEHPPGTNDRTWCFWEKQEGYFEDIVYRRWTDLSFADHTGHIRLDIDPYEYKMIRGVDFYTHCFERIRGRRNIEWLQEKVTDWRRTGNTLHLRLSDRALDLEASYVFSAVSNGQQPHRSSLCLLQHFKGWIIETEDNRFDTEEALLMDFSVDQHGLPAVFVYLLPLSSTQALIEYTVFSETAFDQKRYDDELSNYVHTRLKLRDYKVIHTETGIIPMTGYRFPRYQQGVYYIGTAGGQTKASTGYTFRFIQKQAAAIADRLKENRLFVALPDRPSRFDYYDRILLHVLINKKMSGADTFKRLFSKLPAWMIFRFLDNETTFREDLKVMNSMPWRIFMPAAFRELSKYRSGNT